VGSKVGADPSPGKTDLSGDLGRKEGERAYEQGCFRGAYPVHKQVAGFFFVRRDGAHPRPQRGLRQRVRSLRQDQTARRSLTARTPPGHSLAAISNSLADSRRRVNGRVRNGPQDIPPLRHAVPRLWNNDLLSGLPVKPCITMLPEALRAKNVQAEQIVGVLSQVPDDLASVRELGNFV